jgi:cysteine desulfurase
MCGRPSNAAVNEAIVGYDGSMAREIYLDNAATTAPDPAVVTAIARALTEEYGNPSSLHARGLRAERLVTAARGLVARTLEVAPEEIVFTSGGTESNALAIRGVAGRARGRHIITSLIEHSSVLTTLRRMIAEGWAVTEVPVDRDGRVSPDRVAAALRPDTVLVSIMAVNNEIGTIEPLRDIGAVLRRRSGDGRAIAFHVDAVQAWGKIPLRPREWKVDLMSLSGHKVHGPKGSGVLYVRRGLDITPLLGGGEQERGLRPGTENVPGIVGLGEAARLILEDGGAAAVRMTTLRDRLRSGMSGIPDVTMNTPTGECAPHILNVSFAGVRGETLLHRLEMDGVFTSTGSACHSHDPTPSHVLLAIGLDPALAQSSLRFSLSRFTTAEEIDTAVDAVRRAVQDLRMLVR